MERLVLKSEVLEKIDADLPLQGKIATALGIRLSSLYRVLKGNHPKLTQASVLQLIKTELYYETTDDLLEPETISGANNKKVNPKMQATHEGA